MLRGYVGGGRTLSIFLEGEFALLVVVLVLSSTAILTTLFTRTNVSVTISFLCGGCGVCLCRMRRHGMTYFPLILGHDDLRSVEFNGLSVSLVRCLFESWA